MFVMLIMVMFVLSLRSCSVPELSTCCVWHTSCVLACLLANSIHSAEQTVPADFKTNPKLGNIKVQIVFK